MRVYFNLLVMIIAIIFIEIFWIVESNWRWIGLIGFILIGWYWDKERPIPFTE